MCTHQPGWGLPVQNSHLCYEEHAACLSANVLSCGGEADTENGATSGRKQPGRERLWGWVMAQGGWVVMETSRRCGPQSLLHPIHKELSPGGASVRLWGRLARQSSGEGSGGHEEGPWGQPVKGAAYRKTPFPTFQARLEYDGKVRRAGVEGSRLQLSSYHQSGSCVGSGQSLPFSGFQVPPLNNVGAGPEPGPDPSRYEMMNLSRERKSMFHIIS